MEASGEKTLNTDILSACSTPKNSFFQSFTSPNNIEVSLDNLSTDFTVENATNIGNLPGTSTTNAAAGGGFTCCVPLCYNNSKRNRELSFYVIPKDEGLRKTWLSKISRKNFKPTSGHRVCSAHFEGGKKTYMNNIPTIVPKTIAPTPVKKRNTMTSLGLKRKLPSPEKPKEINSLQTEVDENKFTVDRFKHNTAHFKFYTGFKSYQMFKLVLEYLQPAADSLIYWGSNTNIENTKTYNGKRGRSRATTAETEFFMILIRLRCGFPIEDMAIRFNMSTSNVSRIFITWIDFLHTQLRVLPIWASKKTVAETMPKCFKDLYPTTRVIIDCTEIFTEMPSSYRSQSATFSSYKHHNTAKGLVGIAPSGAVTFVSDLYAGRSSDQKITRHSGILNLLEHGDSLMADRGFDIEEDLPDGVTLNIPAFLKGKTQLDLGEELETRRIASVRVHVERAINRVKNFRILQSIFPLSMAPDLNKVWVICCYLVNFLPPLIAQNEE
ncbi:uncharacterized protein LOC130614396 [Hydractinia symbiolongicarpus]|uniref:uncharacterized protein LOC130614396 n=1 Tax=Hydractinia symbiolongicarpus TaxID=13093 RepID=UPI00254E1782|nr:uncharacterized protein LOC130614396 [Hydractinia symbiolongicarpus]